MKFIFGILFFFICVAFYAQTDTTSSRLMQKHEELTKEKIRFDRSLMKVNPTLENLRDFNQKIPYKEGAGELKLDEINRSWYQESVQSMKKIESREGLVESDLEGFNLVPFREIQDPSEDLFSRKRLSGPSQYDSRIELFQMRPDIDWQFSIFQKSESVAMIIEKEKLQEVSKGIFALDVSQTLGGVYNLCPSESFCSQSVAGVGTAFIYSNNTMITALHVLERPISDYIIIFGYRTVQADGMVESFFESRNIFYPKKIIHKSDELDVAEFSVDRNFDRPALEWEDSVKAAAKDTEIYMIGHPSGLPLKVAVNARVEDSSNWLYYYTSLDSFQGNSGSPVFNFLTNKVIGILVSGEVDYKFNGNCYYSPICKIPYCKGEKAVRIEQALNRF
ncbi:V8-like Glu-specific endopeptidase [Flavobacterium sp. HSC-32F16]|uniref:S1 family peptidase n=1 Tax=Flavobacterium sp. HSC-32F16 TaxID=2910964 RepID=UPI0020A36096|nr:serine protease [Flavobacterium sp. HSC-32F16]MCP2027406.1 V8-like Glu-specific endopeptidase [Flavobacterium sp. HSC-32F16]